MRHRYSQFHKYSSFCNIKLFRKSTSSETRPFYKTAVLILINVSAFIFSPATFIFCKKSIKLTCQNYKNYSQKIYRYCRLNIGVCPHPHGLRIIGYPVGDNHIRIGNRTRLYTSVLECKPFSFVGTTIFRSHYFPVLLCFWAHNYSYGSFPQRRLGKIFIV